MDPAVGTGVSGEAWTGEHGWLGAAPPRFDLSRSLFLRLLGVVYLLAFASLTPQLTALVGTGGLLPIDRYLSGAAELWGAGAYYRLPTLVWLWPTDGMLLALGGLGVVLSVVAVVGVAPRGTFLALWALYLSLTVAGQDFLAFQWDVLLLETGLLAVLYAPAGGWLPVMARRPPGRGARWLLWGLAFKLTFLSGVTKLLSGDATWRGLTALAYHYETQPLPTRLGWYLHQVPAWVGVWSTVAMFVVELVVPFVVFVPVRFRRVRAVGCAVLCGLQLAIAAAGNYGFFNLLTVVLYLSLLDDATIARLLWRRGLEREVRPARPPGRSRPWRVAAAAAVTAMAVLSALTFVRGIGRPALPGWTTAVLGWVAPLRSFNDYGLFRTMTTERPEIVVEGSRDGVTWREYEFRWKPGPVTRAPALVQPHMPRLDWQMWFAALAPRPQAHWLLPLAEQLLVEESAVRRLLPPTPFPDEPPQFVRLSLYRYRFAAPGAPDGAWWEREFLGYVTAPIPRPSGTPGASPR